MFGFVKRILGNNSTPDINHDPFGRENVQLSAGVSVPSAPARVFSPVVLQREEVLDSRTRICGYRFSARRPENGTLLDGAGAIRVLADHDVAGFAQRRMALLPSSVDEWLSNDYGPLIAPNTVFFLAGPDESAFESWGEVVALIQRSGAKVAVSIGGLGQNLSAVLRMVNFVVLDFTDYSIANFELALGNLRRLAPDVGVIVEKVGRWAEFRYCISLGAGYCMGPFTTENDDAPLRNEIGQSRLVLIEMLNRLRTDADLQDIAETAKRDPGVVLKIVDMANSPLQGLRQPVTSVDQAVMVLGRDQLYRWLVIGMFRGGEASPRDEVLLEMALARGRFLEVLGQGKCGKQACDELFLLGLLSLLDSLLGVSMEKVVEMVNLSPALKDVLLNSSGPLGRYLMLAIAVEKGNVASVGHHAELLGYSLESVDLASAEAIRWADEAVRETA